ncbi:DUF2637 domain-containing protein [Verrucosispora sp. TAA-831]|uniref:DUF2637 domain-containing protein n=1 Tax=Verrucosispora sp. TAA-831 TaxID=3422227 RepID=UPI003D6EBBEC
MLVVASAAMVEDKRAGRRVRWSARTAFAVGVAASVAANIAAAEPSLGARIVVAWPAVALLLVVEMLTRTQPVPGNGHRTLDTAQPPASDAASALPLVSPSMELVTEMKEAQPAGASDGPATNQVSAPLRRQTSRRKEVKGRAEPTADVVARLRAERPQASPAELALAAGVSERHVRRLMAGKPPPNASGG